jgi:predicted NBD/HSP70 family sugar kinase
VTETKAVPALLRALNERTILEAVRASGPLSRADVARRTGISRPTVSLVLRLLLEDGLVRETTVDPGRPHYGAVYYEADPEAALVLGVDFGSRSVRTALCDLSGEVRAREEIRSRGSVEERIAALASTSRSLLRTSKLDPDLLERAVVALPAVVSPADGSVSSPDLAGLGASDLTEQLERAVGAPVTLENDVNLAALGEQRNGVAQSADDFAFLLVGAGLGAAIVLGGKLHRGRNGAAGELDAVRNGRPDDVDPCAAAISQRAAELAAGRKTVLEPEPPFEMRELFAAARAGDAVAEEIVDETAHRIALHMLPLAATLDLPLVVLGGSVGANAELLEPIRRRLAEWLPHPPRVEVSALGEVAVLEGAVAAGVDTALEHVFERRARA